MSKQSKPWFDSQHGWWVTWFGGKRTNLAKGKKSKRAAQERLDELRVQSRLDPAPGSEQTVASVIETYQSYANNRLAKSTVAVRRPYLESFAGFTGWRLIRESTPLHMERWLDEHPVWKSDWTRRAIAVCAQALHAARRLSKLDSRVLRQPLLETSLPFPRGSNDLISEMAISESPCRQIRQDGEQSVGYRKTDLL
jgi:hypothetical protein